MATRPKLTPVHPNGSPAASKSAWSLCNGKLAGFAVVIAELEVEPGYLCRAMRLLED
jgi:hypothetical protein